jgi:hypothetical protein
MAAALDRCGPVAVILLSKSDGGDLRLGIILSRQQGSQSLMISTSAVDDKPNALIESCAESLVSSWSH